MGQHAQAQHVTVNLHYTGSSVQLAVADDGWGIPLQTLDDGPAAGQGIAIMRERACQLGGEFSLESKPGHGLRLSVMVPCPDHGAQSQR